MKYSMYNIVNQYLNNPNRDYICAMLKQHQPNEENLLLWLSENMNINKLLFLDSKVKWNWDKDYFYEMITYLHNGIYEGEIVRGD